MQSKCTIESKFQSPSLRGSGRFDACPVRDAAVFQVSIPFIAGQWSLHVDRGTSSRTAVPVSIPFIAGQWSLHSRRARRARRMAVSIPFIAGQWSLRIHVIEVDGRRC